jgi:hypothetical protein
VTLRATSSDDCCDDSMPYSIGDDGAVDENDSK